MSDHSLAFALRGFVLFIRWLVQQNVWSLRSWLFLVQLLPLDCDIFCECASSDCIPTCEYNYCKCHALNSLQAMCVSNLM
jgi:hypothetical protein